MKKPYTGPIEEVRPGDILEGARIDEYRLFMRRKHGIQNAKMWGLNEKWEDSGARPFGTKLPDKFYAPVKGNDFVEFKEGDNVDEKIKEALEEKNPFEDL